MIADLPHCPPPGEVLTIPAPEAGFADGAISFVLEPFQPLREQLTAITGIGLEPDADWPEAEGRAVRRVTIPAPSLGETAQLGFLAAGRPGGQRVVFLHGSPGLGEEWDRFLVDVPAGRYYLAPDRPGFGASDAAPAPELAAQAEAVLPLLGPEGAPPAVLVGYSFGGPVALRLAADHPDRVAGLVLIGSAADPVMEEIDPLQEIAALDFFAQLLPAELASSNAELIALGPELEALAPALPRLDLPVVIVQGDSDNLVPADNAAYLRGLMPQARTVMIEGADHFLPWTHPDILKDALDCVLAEALPVPAPQVEGAARAPAQPLAASLPR